MRLANIMLGVMFATQAAYCQEMTVRLTIIDADSGEPIPARVYLTAADGKPAYFSVDAAEGSAVRYEKQNWINDRSVEYHTTVSAHPCFTKVPAGNYQLIVERGKSYRPYAGRIEVTDQDVDLRIPLRRWVDPVARGWYSGDTHIHRTIEELRNILLAEDLNVAFPLTNWVTFSDTLPAAGDKSQKDDLPSALVEVDETHVIWPRNTEYEIFTVGKKRHTLGALFVLGHQDSLQQTVPPWKSVVAGASQATPVPLFDMDKLDWPFAMLLPTIAPSALYELSNNHTWRTEFAFRNWNTAAPSYIHPPFGTQAGGHRAWIDYTHGMYHTLLNCGFRMPPSAGTANGVHPVPAGFGRVYVHQPDGFGFEDWLEGLRRGRSFVTTGPMVFATADSYDPGHVFQQQDGATEISIRAEVLSEQRLSFGELLLNGIPVELLRGSVSKDERNAFRTLLETSVKPVRSGWFALRFWEERPDGRTRFAHTAPWYVEIDNQPVRPHRHEKEYLVRRMRAEIQRSEGVVSAAAMDEYNDALAYYESLPVVDDSEDVERVSRPASSDEQRNEWLENMIVHHRFTPEEVRLATGETIQRAQAEVAARSRTSSGDEETSIRVLPYPGGRHPRRGFLDGAIDPQRETKISIFPPWNDGGYVVVDVPEAIFSNLGLTYLAHTHIPTIWDAQSVRLPKLEWQKSASGYTVRRELPNGIAFESRVTPKADEVRMEIDLTNGTDKPLTGLRVQVCTMLKGALGFNLQESLEQVTEEPFVAVRGKRSDRWIITSWTPNHRVWTNPPVPCVHSDPIFPDCAPGETVTVKGSISFYEGKDVKRELDRLKAAP